MAYEAITEARRDAETKLDTLREAIRLKNERSMAEAVGRERGAPDQRPSVIPASRSRDVRGE